MGVAIELRSHERDQLRRWLPHMKDRYSEYDFEEGLQRIDDVIAALDTDDQSVELSDDHWETVLMILNASTVKDKKKGLGELDVWWLGKKIARRIDRQREE